MTICDGYNILDEVEFNEKRKNVNAILARVSFRTEKDPIYLELCPTLKRIDELISKEATSIIRNLGHHDREITILPCYKSEEL